MGMLLLLKDIAKIISFTRMSYLFFLSAFASIYELSTPPSLSLSLSLSHTICM